MSLEHSPARASKARPGRTNKGRWPLLMRVSEVAFELGLSRRRVYQLIDAGYLISIKIHRARRVTSASVRKLAGQQDQRGGDGAWRGKKHDRAGGTDAAGEKCE
jgi:excisionase family DNA binding protein